MLKEMKNGEGRKFDPRKFGSYENKIYIPPDFDETNEEIVELFESERIKEDKC
jgi:hypothetical protein